MTTNPLSAISHLDEATCWQLLASHEVGRLAVSIADEPDIFPINYVLDGTSVVFRTAEGTKLAASIMHPKVAFEADGYDSGAGEAWSVVIRGHAREISMHEMVDESAFLLFPWNVSPKNRFVRIVAHEVTGRRFTVAGHAAVAPSELI
jgi:uncharacterized protein